MLSLVVAFAASVTLAQGAAGFDVNATVPPPAYQDTGATPPGTQVAPSPYVPPDASEVGRLQLEIAQIAEQRPSLGLPIVLLSGGGLVGVTGFYLWLLANERIGLEDQATTYLVIGAVGAAVAVGGLIWLINAVSKRRELGRQIIERRERLQQLGVLSIAALDVGPGFVGARVALEL